MMKPSTKTMTTLSTIANSASSGPPMIVKKSDAKKDGTSEAKKFIVSWPNVYSPGQIQGYVSFVQSSKNLPVYVEIKLTKLVPLKYYCIFIHHKRYVKISDTKIRNPAAALGGHFNPNNTTHGDYQVSTGNRHIGDLISNILSDSDGKIDKKFQDPSITLVENSKRFIGNRSIVINQGYDDLGREGLNGLGYMDMDTIYREEMGLTDDSNLLVTRSRINGNVENHIASGNINETVITTSRVL